MEDYSYKSYTDARNASWKVIIDMGIKSLPIDVFKLASDLGIKVGTYEHNKLKMIILGLWLHKNNNEAMYVSFFGKHYIFYDDTVTNIGRIRFTIAHEIGHHILGHIGKSFSLIPRCAERCKFPNSSALERSANVFASRLLAPSIVLHSIGATNAEDISRLCGISHTAAQYRSDRLNTLDKRNCYNLESAERKVFENFKDYIAENKVTTCDN